MSNDRVGLRLISFTTKHQLNLTSLKFVYEDHENPHQWRADTSTYIYITYMYFNPVELEMLMWDINTHLCLKVTSPVEEPESDKKVSTVNEYCNICKV